MKAAYGEMQASRERKKGLIALSKKYAKYENELETSDPRQSIAGFARELALSAATGRSTTSAIEECMYELRQAPDEGKAFLKQFLKELGCPPDLIAKLETQDEAAAVQLLKDHLKL